MLDALLLCFGSNCPARLSPSTTRRRYRSASEPVATNFIKAAGAEPSRAGLRRPGFDVLSCRPWCVLTFQVDEPGDAGMEKISRKRTETHAWRDKCARGIYKLCFRETTVDDMITSSAARLHVPNNASATFHYIKHRAAISHMIGLKISRLAATCQWVVFIYQFFIIFKRSKN
jgi:hypothetical protein